MQNNIKKLEPYKRIMVDKDTGIVINETVAQIIDAFNAGNIDDTYFEYQTLPPEGTVFPIDVRGEIGSGVSSLGIYQSDENKYMVHVLCANKLSHKVFMYVEMTITEKESVDVTDIFFLEKRIPEYFPDDSSLSRII